MDKVMVITGTSKGIGRFLTEYYLDKGMSLIGCDLTESDLMQERYEHYQLDVSNEEAVRKMIALTVKKHKKIDYLINNAGIASMNHSLLTPLSLVDKIFKTNFYGTFLFCREVGKVMTKNKFGKIVNFTSVAVPLNLEGESIYAASKVAIEELTRILAKEFGKNGITCNTIGPSPIRTDLIKNVSDEKLERLLSQQAINEFGSFEDVANVIDFYLSDRSRMITGQTVYLGGVF